jgi:hypothetical protein
MHARRHSILHLYTTLRCAWCYVPRWSGLHNGRCMLKPEAALDEACGPECCHFRDDSGRLWEHNCLSFNPPDIGYACYKYGDEIVHGLCCAQTHVVHMPDLTPKCCEGKCRLGQREDGTDECLGDRNCPGDACCSDSECSQVNPGVCQ